MGVRTRRAHEHSRTHIVGFAIAGFMGFGALLIATLFISLNIVINTWLEDLPDFQTADAYLVPEPTTIYDSQGTVIAEYYLQNRRTVEMDQINPYVIKATIDTEDKRYYQHNGVDPQGILRAVFVQLAGGSEGASTITQQLVRNTVLSDEQFDYSLRRKVREAYIAIQMEKMYTKDQILLMYLNTIYYGDGSYGIEAASINYFNKHASELSLAEAALLAGLPQGPSIYDPTINPDLALDRRNLVLSRMLEAGDITQEEYDAARAEEVVLNHGAYPDSVGTHPYFSDYVRSLLMEDFDANTVLQGGLQVYTTLDPYWQQCAEDAIQLQLDRLGDDELQFGMVALDNKTGYIKALVGGRDYNISQFNTATQARRQVGSSMKTFTLTTAIKNGMSPEIYVNANSPLQVTPNWEVTNYGGGSYGNVTLRWATEESLNTPYAQVALAVGIDKVISTAHDMGISVDLPPYPSICLGVIGIPPVQMAEAYSVLPSDGVHRDAIAITRIEDRNGNVVYQHEDSPSQVLDPAVAEAVVDVLEGVCYDNGGAAILSTNYNIGQPFAGKTGTSENARDLWFVGFTPQVTAAIWCGYFEERMVLAYGSEAHVYQTSTPVFGNFAQTLLADTPREEFPDCGITPEYKPNDSWTFSNTDAYANTGYSYDYYDYYYDDYDYGYSDDTATTDDTAYTDGGTGEEYAV